MTRTVRTAGVSRLPRRFKSLSTFAITPDDEPGNCTGCRVQHHVQQSGPPTGPRSLGEFLGGVLQAQGEQQHHHSDFCRDIQEVGREARGGEPAVAEEKSGQQICRHRAYAEAVR